MGVTFTFDLEDHNPQPNPHPRYPEITYKVLDFLNERDIQGTFFVLGEIAEQHPKLIKDIHKRGHEIGFHTYAHVPLNRENPSRFRIETQKSKALIEDLIGSSIIGFRAPSFSLMRSTLWALPILSELGFTYSSSILPIHHPLYGIPGAPHTPFRWNDTLILEIPAPIGKLGPFSIPFLGGVYLRYLPISLAKHLRNNSQNSTLWTYCHPYDFDAEEKFVVIREASVWVSLILWFNRKNTYKKISEVLDQNKGCPFSESIINGCFDEVPIFDPTEISGDFLP